MKVLLVDPSLFTAPYDAALSKGLRAAGVDVRWAARAMRDGEEPDIDPALIGLHCYRFSDGPRRRKGRLWRAAKGVEHVLDLRRLARFADAGRFDLVHFQWAELPMLDARAMRRIARRRPVVLTVHDTTPLNGARVNPLQRSGFATLFEAADHLIVHSEGGREALAAQGVPRSRISVVPHGPLPLACAPRPVADKTPGRWRIILFGRLQTYKGVDVLIEALGRLPEDDRARLEVIVAGEPLIPLAPLVDRARELGLDSPTLQLRPGRLNDQDMADLLGSADAFVFPYRAIEASGVLYLIAAFRRWIIASALGTFADAIGSDGSVGALLPPDDPEALARALVDSIGRVPEERSTDWAPDWRFIGEQTAELYRDLVQRHLAT